ncbi:nuclear transport factor 2 family protein [Bradyrhizobium sp. C9]|uniref:nuclear transport factor 2 family protein n=1 Tax=Bradyrhizobium sp. C9 TaxID=142585 RepID=UPI0013046AC6|nr:nuclear transport factor 2 family protein [Bradyrhizobium sp. C9]
MAQSNTDLDAVAAAERALAAAHLTLDLDVINRLIHPDYVIVQPGGAIETKADVLASYRSGTRHWDSARVDELDIRLYQETAVVVGRWLASGRNGPASFDYQA